MAAHLHLAPSSPAPVTEASAPPIRVVLADDHEVVLRSLRLLLDVEPDTDVIGEAVDITAAAGLVESEQPDVLVLDLGMSGRTSVETIGRLRERTPATQIVALTMHDNPAFAQRAFAAGAIGFVTKELADDELLQAIHAASRGEQFVSPRIAAQLDALRVAITDGALTPREVEILQLIALGHTSVEVARMLRISPRTVETHRAHIQGKLGVVSRAELVRYALRRGLLSS